MSGRVIERFETTIVDRRIIHDDRTISWDDADKRAGRRLDRRKAWAFVDGDLCEAVSWTQACSGCAYESEPRGSGCSECGHHGVTRESMWVPAANPGVQP